MKILQHGWQWILAVALCGALAGCATTGLDAGPEYSGDDSFEEQSEPVAKRRPAPRSSRTRDARARETRKQIEASLDESDERLARSHHATGVRHLREGKIALAIRELRAAEELNPYDGWIQLALAEAYRIKGLYDDAERHLIKALDHDPAFQSARLTLSGLYAQVGRYEDAIVQSRELVDDPTFPVPWTALTNQGYSEYKLGRIDEARESLRMAIEYHAEYWRAFLNLGILEGDAGHRLDAIQAFERVLELEPGPLGVAETNYRLAEQYISLGNRDRALQHLAVAVETSPNGPWGEKSEEYLNRLR